MLGYPVPLDYPAPGIVGNPSLPFKSYFYQGLAPGSTIFIWGETSANSKSCSICLYSFTDNNLSIIADFVNHILSCKISASDCYKNEEKQSDLSIAQNCKFEIILMLEQDGLRVAFNGKEILNYKHKTNLQTIKNLHIEKEGESEIAINKICYDIGRIKQFAAFPFLKQAKFGEGVYLQPMYYPLAPFITIDGGLYTGRRIQICGIPHQTITSFYINLQCGSSNFPEVEIPFHFSVRFNENSTVLNNFQNHHWQIEQRERKLFPFIRRVNFDILILCDKSSFQLAINGEHFAEFKYRIHLINKIDTLMIGGDVTITYTLIH